MVQRRPLSWLLAGLLLLAPAAAQAGVLVSATLQLDIAGPDLPNHSIQVMRSASTSTLAGSSSSSSAVLLAGSAFSTTRTLTLYTSPASKASIQIRHNGAILATPGGVSATGPISGRYLIIGLGNIIAGGTVLAEIPIVLGTSRTATATVPAVNLLATVIGHAWTVGTTSMTGQTRTSSAVPTNTVAATGSFHLDAKGGGTVKLVTLSRVITSGAFVSSTITPASLTLTFVPEPGTLLLLAAAAAGLAGAGRRRAS